MPVGSIRRTALEGSKDDVQEKTNHFENMRKLYNILWSDNLLSQETFPAFHPFIKLCLEQDRRHGSKLLSRMVFRRAISAVAQAGLMNAVPIRNLVVLQRIITDSDCVQMDITGHDVTYYGKMFGDPPAVELLRRISSEQWPPQDNGRFAVNGQGFRGFYTSSADPPSQYGNRITVRLRDGVEPEVQRPIELKVVRLFVDPGFVEFSDWSFEPRLILRVLRADVRYLNKPLYPGPNSTRPPRNLLKIHAKQFHLDLDLANFAGNDDDVFWHHSSNLLAQFHFGKLGFYFMDNEYKENKGNLYLLDYTLSFGCRDRPGPTLRFLRIIEMGYPINTGQLELNIQEHAESQGILDGAARSRTVPQMRVLSIDKLMRYRPYLKVQGTAIPIYSPLKDLSMMLDGVYRKHEAFPPQLTAMQKLNHALDLMTLYGWTDHVRGTSEQDQVLPNVHVVSSNALQHSKNGADASVVTPPIGVPDRSHRQKAFLGGLTQRRSKVVQVMHGRVAHNLQELSVARGEYLEVLSDSSNWWKCRNQHDFIGYVPHTFLSIVNIENVSVSSDLHAQGRQRNTPILLHDRGMMASGQWKIAPELNDVE